MKSNIIWALLLLFLTACSTAPQPAVNPQVEAIEKIRPVLGLPDLPLEFVEETGMVNSPDGKWMVAMYKDGDGRKYFVEVETNQVVEVDGRDLLLKDITIDNTVTEDDLRVRAEKIANETLANFLSLQPKLTYEEGQKGDNYFFMWRDDYSPPSFNRPFLQLAFLKNGQLFAYYNTLFSR